MTCFIAILMFQGHSEACAVVQKWVCNPHLHVRKIHNYHNMRMYIIWIHFRQITLQKKIRKTLFEKILCSLHCNPHPQLILDVCRLIWISSISHHLNISTSQHLNFSISQHLNISISVTWLTLITRFILWKSSISWFVNTTIPVCHFVIIKQQSGKYEIFGTLLHWSLPSPRPQD